jgi:hypothetical protein
MARLVRMIVLGSKRKANEAAGQHRERNAAMVRLFPGILGIVGRAHWEASSGVLSLQQ